MNKKNLLPKVPQMQTDPTMPGIQQEEMADLRADIAKESLKQGEVAQFAGYSDGAFSAFLTGRRPAPEDFIPHVRNVIRAMLLAQEARYRAFQEELQRLEPTGAGAR